MATRNPATRENIVRLTWKNTDEDWLRLRLIRSTSGYAISETDYARPEDLLLDVAATEPVPTVGGRPGIDDKTARSGWNYYTIWLQRADNGVWARAAIEDVLVPYDFRSDDVLWDRVPDYFKFVRSRDLTGPVAQDLTGLPMYLENTHDSAPNTHLIWFLRVFGWGFDILRTQIDTTMDAFNPHRTHISRLQALAHQFGANLEPTVPAAANRNLVRNLSLLYRKRGTLEGIRETLALAAGWQTDVYHGPNLMLNRDQADFVHPQISDWDRGTKYVQGDYVLYNGRQFVAKTTSFGAEQRPPDDSTMSNTWWSRDEFLEPLATNTLTRSDTGGVSTWQALGPGNSIMDLGTYVSMGAPDPDDVDDRLGNALAFYNTFGSTADILVRSVPYYIGESSFDKGLVAESAIPVPLPTENWRAGKRYRKGDLAYWRGVPFLAQRTTEQDPSTSDWRPVGLDKRVRVAMSFYAHGPFNGTAGTGGVPVVPHLVAFDEQGNLLKEVDLGAAAFTNVAYDPLDDVGTTPVGSKTWSATGFVTGYNNDGSFAYPDDSSRARGVVDTGLADGNVAAVFRSIGVRDIGVVVRWTDDSNYYRADATELVRVQGGASTVLATYPTFLPGDRIRVRMSGGTIEVYKGDTQVASVTGETFNTSATRHGIVVED